MPKASPIQTSFNAGELSPKLEGRVDLEEYSSGCQILENMIPTIDGSVYKRPGTKFFTETEVAGSVLIPFLFNNETAYIIDLREVDARIWANFTLVDTTASLPYTTADLDQISYAQSADVLYLAHPDYPPYKLRRTNPTNFSPVPIDFDWPPFEAEDPTSTGNITASATTGTGISITRSPGAPNFAPELVGSFIKFREVPETQYNTWAPGTVYGAGNIVAYQGNVYSTGLGGTSGTRPLIHLDGTESDGAVSWTYLHSGEGYAKFTGYTDTFNMTGDVIRTLPQTATTGTKKTAFSSWSDRNGYPSTVAFYEDRLLWGGSTAQPQTIWGSVTGDYENHKSGTNADDAYQFTLNSQEVNNIIWMVPGKTLLVGTAGGEFVVSGSTLEEPITPTNVRAVRVDTKGSKANVRPIKIGSQVIFAQNSSTKLRYIEYVFEADGYRSPDLTVLADHITLSGIKQIVYQQNPDQLIWVLLENGKLLSLTYDDSLGVAAWAEHDIKGFAAVVESIAVIPHPDGDQDQLWMVVKRSIQGSDRRFIEYLEKKRITTDAIEDSYFLDSMVTYDGAPTTVIGPLGNLEGQLIGILADGKLHADKVVEAGGGITVTLDVSASVVQLGYNYIGTVQTMRFDAGAADGTSQGKTKRITNCTLRVHETGDGLNMGPSTSDIDAVNLRDESVPSGDPTPLYSGDTDKQAWSKGYEKEGRVTVVHSAPYSCTLTAIMPQIVTQDR